MDITPCAKAAPYRSPYEAYPFLADDADDLRCDFELLTDELASLTGGLCAAVQEAALQQQLTELCALIYHLNPSLRTFVSITPAERDRLAAAVDALQQQTAASGFVLPMGCAAACQAHLLRVRAKQLVRLLYRHAGQGHPVEPLVFDVANLLSGYFFLLALRLNRQAGVPEQPFVSRNYR